MFVRSRKPKAFTPLKTKLARPSHRLSKLKPALIIVGEFLGIARRTLVPATLNRSGTGVPLSTSFPGLMPVNFSKRSPWEARMSFVSLETLLISSKRVTPGPRGVSSVGLNQSLSGKSPATTLSFGANVGCPGLFKLGSGGSIGIGAFGSLAVKGTVELPKRASPPRPDPDGGGPTALSLKFASLRLGEIWSRARISAPALKWQVAQD